MSERHPPKIGLFPAPLPLALLVVLVAIVVLGSLYFLKLGMNAPLVTQTGARASTTNPQSDKAAAQAGATVPSETKEVPTDKATESPTLAIVASTVVFEPTPYAPGPPAQSQTIIPIDQWKTYKDESDNWSIQFPPDWYLTEPVDQESFVRTTVFYNYDPNDPMIGAKGVENPPGVTTLQVVVDSPAAMGFPYVASEPFSEWVGKAFPIVEGYGPRLVEERAVSIGGIEGVLQVIELGRDRMTMIYVPLRDRIFTLAYNPIESQPTNTEILRMMIESIQFN